MFIFYKIDLSGLFRVLFYQKNVLVLKQLMVLKRKTKP